MAISLEPVARALSSQAASPAASPQGAAPGFSESLSRLIDSVETSAATANDAVANMIAGSGEVHEAMIALQRAELTLQLTVQMRNKFVQAYQEIMRMPV